MHEQWRCSRASTAPSSPTARRAVVSPLWKTNDALPMVLRAAWGAVTGKTYSMFGEPDESQEGIIPRAMRFMFDALREKARNGARAAPTADRRDR
jgi:hypothetical protein